MKSKTHIDEFVDIDYETRSRVDVTQIGATAYAKHPSTEILMISFSSNEKDVYNWNPFTNDKKIYKKLMKLLDRVKRRKGKTVIRAHNKGFEQAINTWVAPRQLGWEPIPVECYYCTAVLAANNGYPIALGKAVEAIGSEQQKDKQGMALINFFSKPTRRKGNPFNDPLEHMDKFNDFISYCDDDVRSQIAIVHNTKLLTKREWDIYLMTEKMNLRGLPIDKALCEGALKLVEQYQIRARVLIFELTNGEIESATQAVALKDWINKQGCKIPNMTAPIIEKYLKKKDLKPNVRKALEIRQNVSKTSTSKYSKALLYLTDEHKVHDFIKALMAITGRWKCFGLQPHNMSKPHKDFLKDYDKETLCKLIAEVRLDEIELIYGDIMGALKAATRHMICAPEGEKFVVADYAQVEARIVMWLAGCKLGLEEFAGEGKIYESMAATIFRKQVSDIAKPSFERDVGKETILGCGFGMGDEKFLKTCRENRNLDVTRIQAKSAVVAYRERYPEVKDAWSDVRDAAVAAIETPRSIFKACNGKLVFKHDGKKLYMQLPSKRKIVYPGARVDWEPNQWGKLSPQIKYRRWNDKAPKGDKFELITTWGGTIFQNAVQGIAADVMADGMLNAEAHGYPSLLTVHDEAISQVDKSFGSVEEYEKLLCKLSDVYKGLPIIAEGFETKRYTK